MGAEHDIEPGTVVEAAAMSRTCGCQVVLDRGELSGPLRAPCPPCGHELLDHVEFGWRDGAGVVLVVASCARTVIQRREVRA